jgi:RNA polymerase sigma-70 factor (ECF subfamily)
VADEYHGLEAIYRAHLATLKRFLVARTGDPGEAEDILQDVWFRLRGPTGGPVANGRAYIFQIAHHLVIDRQRERQRRMRRERLWLDQRSGHSPVTADSADPSANAEQALLDQEETAVLASALSTLPAGARRAFALHKLHGHSHAEVAAIMGISKSGVEKHMAVAMKYLRRALLDCGDRDG